MFHPKLFSFILMVLILGSCDKGGLDYTLETKLNPNNISPLTAQLNIQSKQACRATVEVLGANPVEQTFEESSQRIFSKFRNPSRRFVSKYNQQSVTDFGL